MMKYIPSVTAIQRLAAKNKAHTDSEKIYPRNLPEETIDLEEVEIPPELKPIDRAVADYILRILKKNPKYCFNSKSIGKQVHLAGITVKRSLKRLQRLGYLRLKRLKTGHIKYRWHPDCNGGSLTSYDAAESLLRSFPELGELTCPLTQQEALGLARNLGFKINEARSLWKEFKEVCADCRLYSGDETWAKWLRMNLPILSTEKTLERLAS
jgi:hypothetical protein